MNNIGYWLWVTRPEYYLEEDGTDRKELEPGTKIGWSCAKDTKKGDLILLYRTKPKMDIKYLIEADSDAGPDDNWKYFCDCSVLYKFSNAITLAELRENEAFREWNALKLSFNRKAFRLQRNYWEMLNQMLKLKNPGYGPKSDAIYQNKTSNYPAKENDLEEAGIPSPFLSLPEEIDEDAFMSEGEPQKTTTTRYERNPKAREACLKHYGHRCLACQFSFDEVYGGIDLGYMIAHHLEPLSEVGRDHQVDPITDLRPVCPNCHSVIHSRKPIYSIEEVKRMVHWSK